MNCKNCGYVLTSGDQFCKNCGTPVPSNNVEMAKPDLMASPTNISTQNSSINNHQVNANSNQNYNQTYAGNTYNNQNNMSNNYQNNKKKSNIIPILIGVACVVIVGVVCLFVGKNMAESNNKNDIKDNDVNDNTNNNSNNNDNNNPTNVSNNTTKVRFGGYVFSIPNTYEYEVTYDTMYIVNSSTQEAGMIQIADINYQDYLIIKDIYKENLIEKGFQISKFGEQKIKNKSYLVLEASLNNEKIISLFTAASSNQMFIAAVSNYNSKTLNTYADILASASSNNSSYSIDSSEFSTIKTILNTPIQ